MMKSEIVHWLPGLSLAVNPLYRDSSRSISTFISSGEGGSELSAYRVALSVFVGPLSTSSFFTGLMTVDYGRHRGEFKNLQV